MEESRRSERSAELTAPMQKAREVLDEHVRQMMHWHFSRRPLPVWLEKRSELKFEPLKDPELRRSEKVPSFEDEWLRGGPVQRWIPKAFVASRTTSLRPAERGNPKSRVSWRAGKSTTNCSAILSRRTFSQGKQLVDARSFRSAAVASGVEHLAQHRGGICFCVDLDPRWVVKLIKRGNIKEMEAYKDHVIDRR